MRLERNLQAQCLDWLENVTNFVNNPNNMNNDSGASAQPTQQHGLQRPRRASVASASLFFVDNSVLVTGSDHLQRIPKSNRVNFGYVGVSTVSTASANNVSPVLSSMPMPSTSAAITVGETNANISTIAKVKASTSDANSPAVAINASHNIHDTLSGTGATSTIATVEAVEASVVDESDAANANHGADTEDIIDSIQYSGDSDQSDDLFDFVITDNMDSDISSNLCSDSPVENFGIEDYIETNEVDSNGVTGVMCETTAVDDEVDLASFFGFAEQSEQSDSFIGTSVQGEVHQLSDHDEMDLASFFGFAEQPDFYTGSSFGQLNVGLDEELIFFNQSLFSNQDVNAVNATENNGEVHKVDSNARETEKNDAASDTTGGIEISNPTVRHPVDHVEEGEEGAGVAIPEVATVASCLAAEGKSNNYSSKKDIFGSIQFLLFLQCNQLVYITILILFVGFANHFSTVTSDVLLAQLTSTT